MEWPDMTRAQKRSFFCRDAVWCLILLGVRPSAFLVYLLITTPATPEGTHTLLELMTDLWLYCGSILLIFYLICWLQIARSKTRYLNRQSEARV